LKYICSIGTGRHVESTEDKIVTAMNFTQYISQLSFDTGDIDRWNSFDEEETVIDSTLEMKPSADSEGEPVSLEGYLLYRMGKSSGQSMLIWRRRFVYFSFADGGSITVYKESPNFNINRMDDDDDNKPGKGMFRSVYKKLSVNFGSSKRQLGVNNVDFDITHDLPWIAKDVDSDSATFVVEISTMQNLIGSNGDMSLTTTSRKSSDSNSILEDEDVEVEFDAMGDSVIGDDIILQAESFENGKVDYDGDEDPDVLEPLNLVVQQNLSRELSYARSKKKPLRIYFRCEKGSNEKALWLRAFSTFGRLSNEFRRQKGLMSSISNPLSLASSRVRIRNRENATLARDTRNLDLSESQKLQLDLEINSVEQLALGSSAVHATDKEYKVVPAYAYPHRWMTLNEMRQEMILPSEYVHDLRVPGCLQKEIGELKVEVLQCLGLPKLDRTSDTDAVVYLVCGAYSFVTDVVPNRQNPMWLRKARRACKFPIFHAYSSLYVGVFDHEAKRTKDDFAGRIEIHLSRLRPGSVYDITLPLRLSTQVYSRRKRGAIRLRFSIRWTTERDALLSYIPRRPRIPLPQNTTPNYDVSVHCTDPKAFRNIAITVHGAHLPGRFTFVQMRAAIREINYTRKFLFTAMRQSFKHLRQWQSPSISAYVFVAWMHCIYSNQFSLVPAYAVLFFLILLMCNYVRYSTDEPSQCGFVPPSWEEMFMALVRGTDSDYTAIAPLELFPVKASNSKRRRVFRSSSDKRKEYKALTHVPIGKGLLRNLGLLPLKSRNAEDDHLEFPFSNGSEYPKFSLKECLVHRKKESDLSVDEDFDNADGMRERSLSGDSQFNSTNPLSRFTIDMDLPDIMRRDCSGLREFDEEEMNFNATKVVLATGAFRSIVNIINTLFEKNNTLTF
jgi:C2 domain